MSAVSWPTIGDVLPRAADAWNVERKLSGYALNAGHGKGAAKAKGFVEILGISRDDAGDRKSVV